MSRVGTGAWRGQNRFRRIPDSTCQRAQRTPLIPFASLYLYFTLKIGHLSRLSRHGQCTTLSRRLDSALCPPAPPVGHALGLCGRDTTRTLRHDHRTHDSHIAPLAHSRPLPRPIVCRLMLLSRPNLLPGDEWPRGRGTAPRRACSTGIECTARIGCAAGRGSAASAMALLRRAASGGTAGGAGGGADGGGVAADGCSADGGEKRRRRRG